MKGYSFLLMWTLVVFYTMCHARIKFEWFSCLFCLLIYFAFLLHYLRIYLLNLQSSIFSNSLLQDKVLCIFVYLISYRGKMTVLQLFKDLKIAVLMCYMRMFINETTTMCMYILLNIRLSLFTLFLLRSNISCLKNN